MAMHPEIRAVIDDLTRQIGHKGAIEAVAPEPLVNGERRDPMVCNHDGLLFFRSCQLLEDKLFRFRGRPPFATASWP